MIDGPSTHRASVVRADAFIARVAQHGASPDAIRRVQGDFTFMFRVAAGGDILNHARRPTAIFACSDEMAAGMLTAAGQRGIAVPDDIACAPRASPCHNQYMGDQRMAA